MKKENENKEQTAIKPVSPEDTLEMLKQYEIDLESDLDRTIYKLELFEGHVKVLKTGLDALNILCKELMILTNEWQSVSRQKTTLEYAHQVKELQYELKMWFIPDTLDKVIAKYQADLNTLKKQIAENQQKIEMLKEGNTGYIYPGDKKGGVEA